MLVSEEDYDSISSDNGGLDDIGRLFFDSPRVAACECGRLVVVRDGTQRCFKEEPRD